MNEQLTDQVEQTNEQLTDQAKQTNEQLTDQIEHTNEQLTNQAKQTNEQLADQAEQTKEQLTDPEQQTNEQLTDKVKEYFKALSKVSRPSKKEEAASDFMVDFAKEHKFDFYRDGANNVIMKKNAQKRSTGSDAAPVIMQAHLDMVCVPQDYDWKQGVQIQEITGADGNVITMRGFDTATKRYTTLGADDGIGVASIMGILDDKENSHPPIIAIFTTDEEAGMGGAGAIKKKDIQKVAGDLDLGKARMINIDEEQDGRFSTGCAGGVRASLVLPYKWKQKPKNISTYKISITDLTSGHSGVEIDKKRANAHRLMGRLLDYLQGKGLKLSVFDIYGGDFDNAIAKFCHVEVGVEKGKEELFENSIKEMYDVFDQEYNRLKEDDKKIEPGMKVSFTAISDSNTDQCFSNKMLNKVITILMLIPNDVLAMDIETPGLVETSSNLGVIKREKDALWFTCATRSSVDTRKRMVLNQMKRLMDSVGGELIETSDYPGWKHHEGSELEKIFMETYKELFAEPQPVARSIHAGLECGYFAQQLGDIDIIACGPTIHDVHTINETLFWETVPKTVELLAAVLAKL